MTLNCTRFIISVQVLVFFTLAGGQVHAAWNMVPQINISEIYTDNVRLSTHGDEEKEYITQLNPGFSLIGQGARSEVNLNYQLYGLLHAKNDNSNSVNQEAALDSTYRIYSDNLFIDVSGEYTKNIINAQEGYAVDSYFINTNYTDTSTVFVSPYLRNSFGGGMLSEIRARYGQVDYIDVDGLDSTTNEISAHLDGRALPGRFSWYFEYSKRNVKYEDEREAVFESFNGELGIHVASRLTWLFIYGHEDNEYHFSGSDYVSSDEFWRSGLRWMPTRRTSIEATVGERFFGKTYSFAFDHHTRNTVWNIEYQEELQSTAFESLDALGGGVASTTDLQTGTAASLTNDIFVSKGLLCNIRWQKSKTDISLNISRYDRDYQYSNNRELYFHRSIEWVWHISPRIVSTLDYSVEDHDFSNAGAKSQLKRTEIAVAHNLNERMSTSFHYNKSDYDSSEMHADYVANSVILQFEMTF